MSFSRSLPCGCAVAALVVGLCSQVQALPSMVAQIPNGAKFSCATCHVNPAGGGPLNSFGTVVATSYLSNQNIVQWGPALAAVDAAGDGFTNGRELGDPQGTWTIGAPAPGDSAAVTNPGDPNSKPPTTAVSTSTWGTLKDLVRHVLD